MRYDLCFIFDNMLPVLIFFFDVFTFSQADGMKLRVKFGGVGRMFSGESLVKVKWENTSNERAYVALTPNIPGNISFTQYFTANF